MTPAIPPIDGWAAATEGSRLVLRSAGATIVVVASEAASAPIDARAVAARLAAGVAAQWPGAKPEFRSVGVLAGRTVAMQVVGDDASVQLHAVSGTGSTADPLLITVATCRRDEVDEVGKVFAHVAAQVVVAEAGA